MTQHFPKHVIVILAAVAATVAADAKVSLPQFVTDSMVIQHDAVLHIKGTAKGKLKVAPSWGPQQTVKLRKDGSFEVAVPTPTPGGPYSISFEDKDGTVTLKEILSGQVWLCSGQSNMEMPVGGWGKVLNYEQEIESANNPELRLLQIQKQVAYSPQTDAKVNMGGWRTANPQSVEEFSSIGYFFGDALNKAKGMPVGIIDCSWGGTPVEAWSSLAAVENEEMFANETGILKEGQGDPQKVRAIYDRKISAWNAIAEKQDKAFDPSVIPAEAKTVSVPQAIESSLGREIDGIFWFQRTFDVPADLAGNDLVLDLGSIDDEDVTYLNGKEVARGWGYDQHRKYIVKGSDVKPGKNLISIRVTDTGGGGGILGYPAEVKATVAGKEIPLDGDWKLTVTSDFSQLPPRPTSIDSGMHPCVLYNGMMAPLSDMPVEGVLWYQGCANVGRDEQYSRLFKRMIADWRAIRNQPDMPFYFMQLANYLSPQACQPNSDWAKLRQAQADALELPNVFMASAIDIGNPYDIHPKNKREAARRFLKLVTDPSVKAPAPKDVKWGREKTTIIFDSPLIVKGGDVLGFIIRTADGNWQRFTPALVGETKLDFYVPIEIEEIRYNWADCPDGSLYGPDNLPVVPFTLVK